MDAGLYDGKAYKEGRAAQRAGENVRACPYTGRHKRRSWIAGFADAAVDALTMGEE